MDTTDKVSCNEPPDPVRSALRALQTRAFAPLAQIAPPTSDEERDFRIQLLSLVPEAAPARLVMQLRQIAERRLPPTDAHDRQAHWQRDEARALTDLADALEDCLEAAQGDWQAHRALFVDLVRARTGLMGYPQIRIALGKQQHRRICEETQSALQAWQQGSDFAQAFDAVLHHACYASRRQARQWLHLDEKH